MTAESEHFGTFKTLSTAFAQAVQAAEAELAKLGSVIHVSLSSGRFHHVGVSENGVYPCIHYSRHLIKIIIARWTWGFSPFQTKPCHSLELSLTLQNFNLQR